MAISVLNLTGATIIVPSPVSASLAPWSRLDLEFVEYDAAANSPHLVDLIGRGIIQVTSQDDRAEDLELKALPVGADVVEIADSADSWEKKRTTVAALSGGAFPERHFTVSATGADYTTIKAAVDAAIAAGATITNPWTIEVYPGTYLEDPITIQPGIILGTVQATRVDSVFIVANNPAADLFTLTGGYVAGIRACGVTDPAAALFRIATPGSLVVMHGVSICKCSTGIAISAGASVVLTNFSINIIAADQAITTGIHLTGATSNLYINGAFMSAPAALLPLYLDNPVQTAIKISEGHAYISSAAACLAPKPGAAVVADVFYADQGAEVAILASTAEYCGHVFHIGSAGANTNMVVMAVDLIGNILGCANESATGIIYTNLSVDIQGYSGVPGSERNGLVQFRDQKAIKFFGETKYVFETTKEVSLDDYFRDFSTTGVSDGGGTVSDAGGLTANVSAGSGWIRRGGAPNDDTFWVQWDADLGLVLTNNTTNYIYYDSVTSALVVGLAAPGAEGILLATVVTLGGVVRYLHDTRNVIDGPHDRMHQYLMDTRKRALKSGLGVVAGTGARKFSIGSGSYYIALNVNPYAGITDATFSYFYGTNGANEVAAQTQVSNTQWDNAGVLAGMTGGWFRSDTVILTSDGRVAVVYGTAEYNTQVLAEAAPQANTPTFLDPTSFPLAKLVVQEAAGIVSYVDIRPQPALETGAGGAGGVAVHSALAGLGPPADDHPQYFLTSGARAMTGGLNCNTNAITNVTTVNGVSPTAHAVRHQPGGLDAIAVGVPTGVLAGAAADAGAAASLARSDHQHGIAAGVPGAVGTANDSGASSSVARLDHTHAGLTRGANDTSTFAEKTNLAAADLILIEDSAAAGVKKKVQAGNLLFGANYQTAIST
ncbi:MAG: hypothetical protein WCW04_03700, partial [Candidatus Paceibacterota bacterium]